MAVYLEQFDCLFNDFGEVCRIERTGEELMIKHEEIENLHALGLSQYKNATALAYIKHSDREKIINNDNIRLVNNAQRYQVEHKLLSGSGLVKLILIDVLDDEYIDF